MSGYQTGNMVGTCTACAQETELELGVSDAPLWYFVCGICGAEARDIPHRPRKAAS